MSDIADIFFNGDDVCMTLGDFLDCEIFGHVTQVKYPYVRSWATLAAALDFAFPCRDITKKCTANFLISKTYPDVTAILHKKDSHEICTLKFVNIKANFFFYNVFRATGGKTTSLPAAP
jgi:hypothetical protein